MIRPSPPLIDAASERVGESLLARPMGIDTYQEPVVYMRADCAVCRSEGFASHARVQVSGNGKSVIATVNVVQADELLGHGEAGLSTVAWAALGASAPCTVTISHPDTVESFAHVRAKLFGHVLQDAEIDAIVRDVSNRRYSDVQLSALLAGCAGERMASDEVVALTRAMVSAGDRLDWGRAAVFDKHCVGGLPGNRTTPIVVAIVAACGLVIPKTSSRAITSPAGTADTMATLTTVDLSLDAMRRVIEREGGCLVWGGAVRLSPADDILIGVERALDLDSEAQLVASVLSKKLAAGSTHAVIDVPMGPTAKVRDRGAAERLAAVLRHVGSCLGLDVRAVVTDGTQPVGRGIGPALEARDVLQVLQGHPDAPADLRDRAAFLAGTILEIGGAAPAGSGVHKALTVLEEGAAWRKFEAICRAQGELRDPPVAALRHEVVAARAGRIEAIDNRRLAKVAKLAGAPGAPAAGVDLQTHLGDWVEVEAPVLTVYAETPGELRYALRYLQRHADLIRIGQPNADT